MIGKELLDRRPVTIYEVEELLEGIDEPTYEQKASLDYVSAVKKVDRETAMKKLEELRNLGIDEELAVKLVDIYPRSVAELQAVLYRQRIGEDLYEKILKVFKE